MSKDAVSKEAAIFNRINSLPRFGYSQVEIVRMSGLNKSSVSRFVNGREISLSSLLILISSMPPEFQKLFWRDLLPQEVFSPKTLDWEIEVHRASAQELLTILRAAPQRLDELMQAGDTLNKQNLSQELCA